MRSAASYLQVLTRLAGLVQIVLGLLFWSGNQRSLIPIHMLVGLTLVLGLWALAAMAAGSGESAGPVVLAAVWGAIVLILGLTQTRIPPGPSHWVVQVVHLLFGLGAIGMAERMASAVKGSGASPVGV